MASEAGETMLELTIRCALQSFSDRTMRCPAKWTVLQLKQHLHDVCESKPEVARQRLIYAGHCLENAQTLDAVLRGRSASDAPSQAADSHATTQVVHLVCAPKEQQGGGVRFRKTAAAAQRPAPVEPSSPPPAQPAVAAPVPLAAFQYGNAFYGYPQPQQAGQQQPQNAYDAYAASYQNYINQMLYYQQQQFHHMMLQHQHAHAAAHFPHPPQQLLFHPMAAFGAGAGAAAAFGAGAGAFQPPQQQQVVAGNPLAQAPLGEPAAPVAAGAAPEVLVGGGAAMEQPGEERQPDLLDMIYKLVRFSLLAMILYLYSSWERFFSVLAMILVIWFVQMRRERHNRLEVQQREVRRLQQPLAAQEDGGAEASGHDPQQHQQEATALQQQSAWHVFWSTVASFFTSLVPENPGPLNVN